MQMVLKSFENFVDKSFESFRVVSVINEVRFWGSRPLGNTKPDKEFSQN